MDYTTSDVGGVHVYHLRGRFNHTDNDKFTAVLTDIQKGAGRMLRFDLSELDYLDSFGIGLFLVARDEARRASNRLEFAEPRGAVRKLFELAGLTALLSPERSAAGAPRAVGSPLFGPGKGFAMSEVTLDEHGTCHLSLAGRFTFADHEGFRLVIDAIGSNGGKRWRIDLSGLEFMDSAALSMLLIARDQARDKGVDIILVNPQGRVRQLFDLADIPAVMSVEAAG